MHVVRFTNLDSLAHLANDWDRLSGSVPFRTWAWLCTWWRHYGRRADRSLFVLGVFDRLARLVAVAPWFLQSTATQGSVLRFLGSGEVCSDYLSVLCEPGREADVAEALAEWLSQAEANDDDRWDLFHCAGVDGHDHAVAILLDRLAEHGHTVHRRPGPNCWRIELPERWDDYLAMLSKNHRRQLRHAERTILASGRVAIHTVQQQSELADGQRILIDLHQRRRRQLGEPGCFRSESFTAFHREVMAQLLTAGQLQLHWIELDGQPIAIEYQLAGNGVVYAYQSGIAPEMRAHSPGHLIHLMTIRQAIASGYRAFDFLRGDESYKAHWRAQPHVSLDVRVVPSRPSAQLRHNLWLAGSRVKGLLKKGLGR
jgi:CelD/BcsL family acetyltransferase involved in cellulose biosynthesis